ncbi:cysteine dioxygenase family protein [Nocardioides dubius]|uniref:Cysteine dioxygenase n=1 Tax=Nocardioides dubius TaxID=317019 RepID=A0ABN1U198_9ACTN
MSSLAVLPLLEALREIADDPELLHLHDPDALHRQRTELIASEHLHAWLITWPPGSSSGWHDHGDAGGAFTTIAGRLTEYSRGGAVRSVGVRDAWSFTAAHVHDVRNLGTVPATSVHVYSPRLASMTRYRVLGRLLDPIGVEPAAAEWGAA